MWSMIEKGNFFRPLFRTEKLLFASICICDRLVGMHWLMMLELAGGLVLLNFGAEWLIKGGARLGMRLGMTPLVVGLTIIAFGTSTPELAVSMDSALRGLGGLAVGNVVGSNIFNIAVVLGLCVLVQPITIRVQLLRVDIPILIAVSFLTAWFLRDDSISRGEAVVLVLCIVGYLCLSYWLTREKPSEEITEEFAADLPVLRGSVLADLGLLATGLALLVAGSHFMVEGASRLALLLGVSETVVGLFVVAAGTSLPEVACSVVAAAKGNGDIAAGNVVGSCLFNLLAILGLTGIVQPSSADDLKALDLVFMIGLSVFLLPLARTGYKLSRWEGVLFLLVFAFYMALRWP